MRTVSHMVTGSDAITESTVTTVDGAVHDRSALDGATVLAGADLLVVAAEGPPVPVTDPLRAGELVAVESVHRYVIGTADAATGVGADATGVEPWPPDPDGFLVVDASQWPDLEGVVDGQRVPVQFVLDALAARTSGGG